MKYFLLVTLASLALSAQSFAAIGTTFASVTDGTNHCYFWLLINPLYDVEVACYQGTTQVGGVHAKRAGDYLIDFFPYASGMIGWQINPDNSYQITANCPGCFWTGTFK